MFVEQPEGCEVGRNGKVCHILRAVYGCKKASRLWGCHFATTLITAGAVRSAADPCIFEWSHADLVVVIILVHVDDILLAAKDLAGIKAIQQVTTSAYTIRELGEVGDFLGMHITRDRATRTLTLSSAGHTRALVEAHGLASTNMVKTPMAPGTLLTRTGTRLLAEGGPAYAELVGGPLYLATATRPYIAFAAALLSRIMHAPDESHWRAAKQVLGYLAGTVDMGLCFGG